jgi:hypothetical protein
MAIRLYNLTRDPATMTIGDIMGMFSLLDLCGARCLQVWTKVQLQNRSYHTFSHLKQSMPFPPSEAWTSGRGDVVLINTDNNKVWPHSGFEGVSCLIFLYVRLVLLISQLGFRAPDRPVVSYFSCRPIRKSPNFSWYRFISRVCSEF